MDPISAIYTMFGAIALLASWVILLVRASQADFAWGLFTVLLPPLSYLYGLFRLDLAGESIVLAIAGCILLWAGLF